MKQNELTPLGFEVVDLSEIKLLRGGGPAALGCAIFLGECGGAPGGGSGGGGEGGGGDGGGWDQDAGCSRTNGMCPGGRGCGIANGMCHERGLI